MVSFFASLFSLCQMSFSPCLPVSASTLQHISMFDMHILPFCCVIQCYLGVNTALCGSWSCLRTRGGNINVKYCHLQKHSMVIKFFAAHIKHNTQKSENPDLRTLCHQSDPKEVML